MVTASKTLTENDIDTFTNTASITDARAANATFVAPPPATKTVPVQNIIEITNKVRGNIAKTTDYFKVKVIIAGNTGDTYTISGQDSSITYGGSQITPSTTYTVGQDNYIYLKHDQKVTIGTGENDDKIPAGIMYQIIEDENTYETYIDESPNNNKDSGQKTTSSTSPINRVDIVNRKDREVPTGAAVKIATKIILVILTTIAVTLVLLKAFGKSLIKK